MKVFNNKEHPQRQVSLKNPLNMKEYLLLKLIYFGFNEGLVQRLFEAMPTRKELSLEAAVSYLTKDESTGKYNHVYRFGGGGKCTICSEELQAHSNEEIVDSAAQDSSVRELQNTSVTCQICYSEISLQQANSCISYLLSLSEIYSEEELIRLKCEHDFCEECIKEYFLFQVSVGRVQSGICCPDVQCSVRGDQIGIILLKNHLMSPETYQKYQKFKRRLEIYKDPNLKGCPAIDCEGFLRKPLQTDLYPGPLSPACCFKCEKIFCFNCLHPWHPSESCDEKIDKGYQEWAEPNSDTVGTCTNCGIKIEKEGGCPHMICQMCKHEWCWICKQAFPVHTPECPKYDQYLELLHFQGMENSMLDGDESIHPNGWFMYSGGYGSLWFWFSSFLFMLLVGVPCILVFNVFVTPVYMLSLFFKD